MNSNENESCDEQQTAGFTLVAGGDGTCSTGELAAIINRRSGEKPSTQTIRNHAEKGTITGVKEPDRGWRFKPDAAEQYIRNRPTPKHGGKRKHADDGLPSQTLTGTATMARDARATIQARLTSDEHGNLPDPPANAMRLEDVLRLTEDELQAIVSIRTPTNLLDSSQLSRLDDINKLQLSAMKVKEKKGELVEGNKIARAWIDEQQRIAGYIMDVPKQVAPRIAAACWVSDEHTARICKMLKAEEVGSDIITMVANELARPPELAGRIREIIDDAVRKVFADVAAPPQEHEHE